MDDIEIKHIQQCSIIPETAQIPPPPHVIISRSTLQPLPNIMMELLLPHPSIQSQPSIDSQQSIESQASVQSERGGLFTQFSSLGFLPSLATFFPDGTGNTGGAIDHRCIATIRSERGAHISSLAVVGDYLYAGAGPSIGSFNSICVWQKVSLTECRGFGSGFGAVKALVVVGDRILSAHQDLKIRIWSRARMPGANRHRPKQVAEGDSHLRVGMLQEVNALAAAGSEGLDNSHKLLASMPTVKDYLKSFIPPKNYVQVRRHHKRLWIEHVDTISMLAVGGTGIDPMLYSASWDRTIKVWKLSDFKCMESFKAHDDAINALLVAPDGFLYTASADMKVKVWDRPGMTSGESQQQKKKHSLVAILEAHKSAINALALSRDGEWGHTTLYSAGCDRGIVVWERDESVQHMVAAGVLRGHRQAVLCLASTGNVLCSGSADRTIRVWRRLPHQAAVGGSVHSCVALLQGHNGPIKCLSLTWDAGNYRLYSSSLDHDIKLWQLSGDVNEGDAKDIEDMASTHMQHEPRISPWKFLSI